MRRHLRPTPRLAALVLVALGVLALLVAGGAPRAGADRLDPTEPVPIEAPEAAAEAVATSSTRVGRRRRDRRRHRAERGAPRRPRVAARVCPRRPTDDEPFAHRRTRSRPPHRGPPARATAVR